MTREERVAAELFLHEMWTEDAYRASYDKAKKRKWALIARAIWSDPKADTGGRVEQDGRKRTR